MLLHTNKYIHSSSSFYLFAFKRKEGSCHANVYVQTNYVLWRNKYLTSFERFVTCRLRTLSSICKHYGLTNVHILSVFNSRISRGWLAQRESVHFINFCFVRLGINSRAGIFSDAIYSHKCLTSNHRNMRN